MLLTKMYYTYKNDPWKIIDLEYYIRETFNQNKL